MLTYEIFNMATIYTKINEVYTWPSKEQLQHLSIVVWYFMSLW